MRIAVEATALTRTHKTGVDNFILGLLEHTIPLMRDDSFELCYFGGELQDLGVSGPNVSLKPTGFPRQGYQALLRYAKAPAFDRLTHSRPDIFFFPNFVALPLAHSTPQVVLVHDLSYLDTPQYFTHRLVNYLSKFVPKSVAASTEVIVNSEFTKKRLIEAYGTSPSKISVIHPGIDRGRFKPAENRSVNAVNSKYVISRQYILFTGTLTDRKNVTSLLRAYRELPAELQNQYALVLAGGKLEAQPQDADINQLLAQPGQDGKVITTGFVDDAELPALYTGSSLFVYPSRYEGFGMPILEAMACGVPVITSNTSSLPEVGGSAAVYISPDDVATLAARIAEILTNGKKAEAMIKAGLENIARFRWGESARKLAAVLRSAVS